MNLICPVCKNKLVNNQKSYICSQNHCFDISKSGYTNLKLSSSKISGDTPEMVLARIKFLSQDFYLPLKQFLIAKIANDDSVIDLGCGEGYYTSSMASKTSNIIAVDLSKSALTHGSKNDKITNYILASIFEIPISDMSADIIFNIFAPYPEQEVKRTLKESGYFIKVDPGPNHLFELKQQLYKEPYLNETKPLDSLVLKDTHTLTYQIDLNQQQLLDLYHMTPYCYKTSIENFNKLKQVTHLTITCEFVIYTYSKQ